jgi:hypothetical protein
LRTKLDSLALAVVLALMLTLEPGLQAHPSFEYTPSLEPNFLRK